MRCDACPVPVGRPCPADRHRRYCELARRELGADETPYRDAILRKSGLLADPVPPAATVGPWEFVTTERLTRDTRTLMAALPPDVDLVVAIARSGLLPGSILSYHLHTPLWTVSRHTGIGNIGHGLRLENRAFSPPNHVLLIDDTAATGAEMAACHAIVRGHWPDARITRAVVYAHPKAAHRVDAYHATYPGMHYLEWNWCNAGHGESCAYDFDGILCRDFTAAECATPESYRAAMATISPLYLPRRAPVSLVVTARPESTRDLTEAWLARHRVEVCRLVMRDWGDESDHAHDPARIAGWKAGHYLETDAQLFAESDPAQAEIIAEIAGKAVLCPALGRVIPPRAMRIADEAAALRSDPRMPLVNACPERGCRTGCGHAICKRMSKDLHISECFEEIDAGHCPVGVSGGV